MKIRFQFEGGQSRYGIEAVNFITIHPEDVDTAIKALGDDADELYEEIAISEDDSECKGYDEMVDKLADKLRDMDFDLHDVEWWYGSEADGSPSHIGE